MRHRHLQTHLFGSAHLEEVRDDVKDDEDNLGIWGGEQIHQGLQDPRVDQLEQLAHSGPHCEVGHRPDCLLLDLKLPL